MVLLKNGIFIDWQTLEFRQTDVLAEPNPLTPDPLPVRQAGSPGGRGEDPATLVNRTIDCSGKFITKSFANGHHHVYSALARGMNPPKKNPQNFSEILQYIWWTLDKSLDRDMIRSSALFTAMACAKNGVTFVIDHHASPFAIDGSLEIIAEAFKEVGVNHLLCYEVSDRDGPEIAEKGLNETASYLLKRQGLVGLHASFTVGDKTLKQAVDLASLTNSGIHIHVAEDLSDEQHCEQHYRKRVIERLSDAGVLQFPKSILAHCIHLNEQERKQVHDSPAWVVENMESNLNNAVGFFNSDGLSQRIMFGTDGMHSDMLRSAKAAFFAGHNFDAIDYHETYRRFRNVHHYLDRNGFSGDGDNNLVVLDYDTPTPLTQNNFLGHFLFGLESRHVQHVISNGKLIVEDGKILRVDEDKILSESRRQASRLWKAMQHIS